MGTAETTPLIVERAPTSASVNWVPVTYMTLVWKLEVKNWLV